MPSVRSFKDIFKVKTFFLIPLLAVPVFFLFMGVGIFIFMNPDERYCLDRAIFNKSFDKALEISSLNKRSHYLNISILTNEDIARKKMIFIKNIGSPEEASSKKTFLSAYSNHPDRGLIKELKEVEFKLNSLKVQR